MEAGRSTSKKSGRRLWGGDCMRRSVLCIVALVLVAGLATAANEKGGVGRRS
jgi:hypothetical protein